MATPRMQLLLNFEPENVINYLQQHRLLVNNVDCQCGNHMNMQRYANCIDGVVWRCSRCKRRISIRQGSVFSGSHLTISQLMSLIFDWVCEVPVTASAPLNGVNSETAINWYESCRQNCTNRLIAMNNILGGPNHTVEVDESLMFKRKNNIGHVVEQNWIFGAYDTTLKKGMVRRVQHRNRLTLEPIIQAWIAPGSTIRSDEWGAYNNLANLGYVHETVNHSLFFTDPVTGTTTNHVESYWARIKRPLKYIFGSCGELKWSHLDEIQYRIWFDWHNNSPFENYNQFLDTLRLNYPL